VIPQQELELGGLSLRISMLGGRECTSGILRVARVLGPVLRDTKGAAGEDVNVGFQALVSGLQSVSEEDFLWFFDRFLEVTQIGTRGVGLDGRKTDVVWTPLQASVLAGKPRLILELMAAHFRLNYADFFGGGPLQT
jgi:hypothetical protein